MADFHYESIFPNAPKVREALQNELALKPWLAGRSGDSTLLINAKVIDTNKGTVSDSLQNVLIKNGLISSITPADGPKPDGGQTLDVKGQYLCPGLIDNHVHITGVPGTNTIADMARLPEQTVTLRTTYMLRRMLQRGFTTVRDCGGATKILADALDEGLIEGPRLFQCGKAISQTGGHGDFITPGISGGDQNPTCCGGHSVSLGRVADGVPAVLKAVREELKQGADFIKVMLGGGVASESDGIETVQYSAEEVRAITGTAWQMGKKMVTAHAYTVEAIRHAIDNGCLGIEHGNLMDQETAELMAAKNVWYTPTLSCYGVLMREPFDKSLSDFGRTKSITVMQQGMEALKMAHKAGVNICYGSDLLIGMQAFQTEEFYVRSKALPAADILKHATVNPAKLLKREGKLGVIAEGAIADLIILSASPLDDITVLDRPELNLKAVFQAGRVVSGGL